MVLSLERGLTPSARVTLMAAHHEAARTGSTAVRSDHLLVSLLEKPDESVRAVLGDAGTDPETVLSDLRRRVAEHPPSTLTVDAAMQMITADAAKEASRLGADAIDDAHLLLALLRDSSDVAGATLIGAGLSLDGARTSLRAAIGRRSIGSDRVIGLQPAQAMPGSQLGFRRTAHGTLVVDGGRPGWTRRADVPSRQFAALRAATNPSPVFGALLAVMLGSGLLLAATDPTPRVARLSIIAFIVSGWIASVCVHEYGHAAMAFLGGERRVADRGGLSLDPRRYVDPLFSVILPLVFLLMGSIPLPGGSVNVQTSALRSRNWSLAVAIGGPVGSLVCLVVFSVPFLLGLDDRWPERSFLWSALGGLALVEAATLVLTLLPVPPLDGFRILSHWLPDEFVFAAYQLGCIPIIILYVLMSQTPLGNEFWSVGYAVAEVFQIPRWLGWYGLHQLRL